MPLSITQTIGAWPEGGTSIAAGTAGAPASLIW